MNVLAAGLLNMEGTARVLAAARRPDRGWILLAGTVRVYGATAGTDCRDGGTNRTGAGRSPSRRRNYLYVEDLAGAHVRAPAPAAADQMIALAGGTPVSVREIAGTVRELVVPVPAGQVPARAVGYEGVSVSSSLARELPDWPPQPSSGAGLRRCPDWLGEGSCRQRVTGLACGPPARPSGGQVRPERCPAAGDQPPTRPAGAPPARPCEVPGGVPAARRTAREADR